MAPLISLATFCSNWVINLVNLYIVVWHVVVLSFNIIYFCVMWLLILMWLLIIFLCVVVVTLWYPGWIIAVFCCYSNRWLCTAANCSLVLRPHPWGEVLVTFRWFLRLCKIHACCMHSWKPITNLCAKKVVCHCAEVAKDFRHCATDCVFRRMIGEGKILSRK